MALVNIEGAIARLIAKVFGGVIFGYAYFAAFFGALALSAAAGALLPPARRRGFHAAVGLAFMAAFLSPVLAAVLLALAWAVRSLAASPSPRRLAAAAALPFTVGAALVYGGFFLRYERGVLMPQDWVRAFFLVNFLKRLLYYTHERSTGKLETLPAGEHLAYFFALPLMVGLAVVPSPSHWRERWQGRPPLDALRRGAATLALAALHLLAFAFLVRGRAGWFTLLSRRADASIASWPASRAWLSFAAACVGCYLARYAYEQTCVGAARLLGWDIRDNYESPLLASDYAEHWRRWSVHSRDFLLSVFYYPVALSLARSRPERRELNLAAAGLATFAGSGVLNLMTQAVFVAPLAWISYRKLGEQIALYEAFQWTLVTGFALARLRRRDSGAAAPGPASRVLGAASTILLRGASLALLTTTEPPVGAGLAVWLLAAAL